VASDYVEEGLALMESGDYTGAVESFSKALRLTLGDLATVLVYRGDAYAAQGEHDLALADFNEALRQNPYLPEAYAARGNLRRLLGDLYGAVEDHTAALQIEPEFLEAYYNRALALEELHLLAEAEADLTRVLTLNPGVALGYYARGQIRAARRDYTGAISDLQRYLRMGGGRTYDNHGETQSLLLTLQFRRVVNKVLPFV